MDRKQWYATSKNIENPLLCFKVEKSWIKDKNIDPASIILNSYSDKRWEPLAVSQLSEDDKFLYFTAKASKFSFFAISGEAKSTQAENGTKMQPGSETGILNENDTGNIESEIKQEAEQKKSQRTPGFEMIYGVIGLLAVFLHKRK
jgi:hypothetical protein